MFEFHFELVTNSLNTIIMYRVILSLFLIAFEPVLCSPTLKGEADSPIVSLEAIEVVKNVTELENNAVVQNPKCLFNSNKNSDISKCNANSISNNNEDRAQTPSDVISVPSGQVFVPVIGLSPEYMQPAISDAHSWTHTPYEVNPTNSIEPLGLATGHFGGVLYPHANQKMYSSLYPSYPVKNLPPVHSTYIHGIIPSSEDSQLDYDLDLLNAPNTRFLPRLVRPGRMLRSSEEDFLSELSHDAMMNNILPSMSIPFFRYASPVVNPDVYRPRPLMAVFHQGAVGSAQPFLFTCSPKISRGFVAHNVHPDAHRITPVQVPTVYREDKSGKKVNNIHDILKSLGKKREPLN